MYKVVEAFSGIGSQHKALQQLKDKKILDFEIINTIEWDLNAIYAYDIIHNGEQDISVYDSLSKEDVLNKLSQLTLSADGKSPITRVQLSRFNEDALKSILYAIERTNNLVSIKDVTADSLNKDIDILTYSFPCQDLSISGFFHGDKGGIDRNANNSSSMLWEVERILFEMNEKKQSMPRFLVMENVSSITSKKHIENFKEWISSLEELNYTSRYFELNSEHFGVPQRRKRTFMISVFHGGDIKIKNLVTKLLKNSKLNEFQKNPIKNGLKVSDILRLDYDNYIYYNEALDHIPNNTVSREKIYKENPKIINKNFNVGVDVIRTLTTKQDRHPNSGVITIDRDIFRINEKKSQYRFLTPRESFMLMGFDEEDYSNLIEGDMYISSKRTILTKTKLTKMAGNSIVVNVIKEVFREITEIDKEINKINNNK